MLAETVNTAAFSIAPSFEGFLSLVVIPKLIEAKSALPETVTSPNLEPVVVKVVRLSLLITERSEPSASITN